MTIWVSPKEEDPQISVPMADVIIQAPGASAQEIEKLVGTRLEKLLWQVKDVEDVYSISRDDMAVVTVKFEVNTDYEKALIRLHNQIQKNTDQVPGIVTNWFVKPITINDVPIINIVLHSSKYTDYELRKIADELLYHLTKLPDISYTSLTNGRTEQVIVSLDVSRLAGFKLTPLDVERAIRSADQSLKAGGIDTRNIHLSISSQAFLKDVFELRNLVVGSFQGRPIYLRDVATIRQGPSESENYSFYYTPSSNQATNSSFEHAVTIALGKKEGTNAVTVSREIKQALQSLAPELLPSGVAYEITRDYGATAQSKVNDLIISLTLAIGTVVIILLLFLGWRESLIVAVSVPVSFALALFCSYLMGFTINRVTLFALILSLGIVVDDPITNVENIQRHLADTKDAFDKTILLAIHEVLPPVIMATLTIIVAFLPMFFITGMMGPYMAPMASTVPLAVSFSTLCALTIVPWLSRTLLTPKAYLAYLNQGGLQRVRRVYQAVVSPFIEHRVYRYAMLGLVLLLMTLSVLLMVFQRVPLKLLPFDNKDELELVVDMPEGTTLESSLAFSDVLAEYLKQSPYIKSFTSYVGAHSPIDFNGMVRHHYMRNQNNLLDIRLNLLAKEIRGLSSHKVSLKLRKGLAALAEQYHAKLSIVEMPPGPPVLQTLVAEITAKPSMSYRQMRESAEQVARMLEQESLVVEVDTSIETPRHKVDFIIDKEKAALNGISADDIANSLQIALGKLTPMSLHKLNQREVISIELKLAKSIRSNLTALSELAIRGNHDKLVPLISLGKFEAVNETQPRYSKNLEPIVYVMANTAGRPPIDVILAMNQKLSQNPLPQGISLNWSGEGEFKITKEVFRDMGLGYLAALVGIYILLLMQTNSWFLPLLMMLAIPLTIIGIMPGFWILNLISNYPIDGFPTPIYFTATGMIGMIALGGIVIRNSVILIDFIQKKCSEGLPLKEAVLESGAVRLRPIFLTAMTTALSAWPITMDPIFSGLAWSLIFGVTASTLFTLVVIPVAYYAFYQHEDLQL